MPEVVSIRFKQCGKIYDFEVNGIDAEPGMRVVVESEMGLTLGFVVKAKHNVDLPEQQFKKILRIATGEDIETDKNNRSLEEEAKTFCVEKAESRNLPMRIVSTEATLDKKRLIFYFTAEGRIDFRELVRDLASRFKTRIEMRQIGVRDEVKLVGGIGICGREVCCRTFLTSFEPISIRMAKKQELALNPGKLSGICGRLMCCLGYEVEQPGKEEDIISVGPEDETIIVTEEGVPEGEVIEDNVSLPSDTIQSPEGAKSYQEPSLLPQYSDTPEQQEPMDTEKKNYIPERKDRGKPFSRRKKFLKNKKRER